MLVNCRARPRWWARSSPSVSWRPKIRTESRWGLYHYRADYPERNDTEWFTHCHLRKTADGEMESIKRPVEPYILPLDDDEKTAYQRLRIVKEAAIA